MDPVSASGLALSAVSLAFQVFSGCVKAYQILIEAEGLPKKYEYLRLRLQLEQCRLLDWATVAEISDDECLVNGSTIADAWQLEQSMAMKALKQMESLLSEMEKMGTKLSSTLPEGPGEPAVAVGRTIPPEGNVTDEAVEPLDEAKAPEGEGSRLCSCQEVPRTTPLGVVQRREVRASPVECHSHQ